MTPPNKSINSTGLSRDIRFLELLASDGATGSGGYGVTELARLTGQSKAVVSRAMSTMAQAGLVDRNPETRAYSVGSRIFALAARSADAKLVQMARPILAGLVRATRETAHLCVLSHGNELTLASELSPHELRSASWQGVTTSAMRTASGRVLLSDWDEAAVRDWYAKNGDMETVIDADLFGREDNPFILTEGVSPKSHVHDLESLLDELARVRRQGFALLDEEFESGIVGVSAPVFDHTHKVVAAVNVSGPKDRLASNMEPLTVVVRRAASSLSTALGAIPARGASGVGRNTVALSGEF